MRRIASDKLFAFPVCERGSRDIVFLKQYAQLGIPQVGCEKNLADNARCILQRLHKRVLAVDIDFFTFGIMPFWSHGAR